MNKHKFLAVDLGASSGRVIEGVYDGTSLRLSEVHRFSNQAISVNDGLYWDILKLFQEIKIGIKKAAEDGTPIKSISIDTWGVDYCYIDGKGDIIANPHCYRDNRMGTYEDEFYQQLSKRDLFYQTGVQPSVINTVLQIYADIKEKPYLLEIVDRVLFMPDLIAYLLSETQSNEYTIASTSGLLDIQTQDWSEIVFKTLGIPLKWFSKPSINGKILRNLSPRIVQELNIDPFPVIAGAGHDTAAAVIAIPYENRENAAFISSGTWSLVGVESKSPVCNEAAFEAGITNEGCFNGNYRLLSNTTGMWLVQELQRDWRSKGEDIGFGDMVKLAEDVDDNAVLIDPNYDVFASPNNMEEKMLTYIKRTNQEVPQGKGELLRCVYESLALSYKNTIESLEKLIDRKLDCIHMVGGGIQNQLICQLTADYTGKKVIAGPIEASAMGNILSQLLTMDLISYESIPALVKASEPWKTYMPKQGADYQAKFKKFKKVMELGELC